MVGLVGWAGWAGWGLEVGCTDGWFLRCFCKFVVYGLWFEIDGGFLC